MASGPDHFGNNHPDIRPPESMPVDLSTRIRRFEDPLDAIKSSTPQPRITRPGSPTSRLLSEERRRRLDLPPLVEVIKSILRYYGYIR